MGHRDLEHLAKHLFDSMPHNHPSGRIPDWELQPDEIKHVFRQKARLVDSNSDVK